MNLLFVRKITVPQLGEYADTFSMPVVRVDVYTARCCLSHVTQDTTDVYLMQTGPFGCLAQALNDRNINIHLINTEQLTRLEYRASEEDDEVAFPFQEYILRHLQGPNPTCQTVIDYSAENLRLLSRHASVMVSLHLHCFRPRVHLDADDIIVRDHGSVFVGDANSRHREHVLSAISNVRTMQSVFGAARDAFLRNFKVLVNVHFGRSYSIFEELRCVPCVLEKMIVVSETSRLDPNHPVFKFIVFVEHEQIAAKVAHILANYQLYVDTVYTKQLEHWQRLLSDIKAYEDATNARKPWIQ